MALRLNIPRPRDETEDDVEEDADLESEARINGLVQEFGSRSLSETLAAYGAAIQLYKISLDKKPSPRVQAILGGSVVTKLIKDAQTKKTIWDTRSLRSRAFATLTPLLRFISRYSSVIDSATQADPLPTSLIWGGIKFLVHVMEDFIEYHSELLGMLGELGELCERLTLYIQIYKDDMLKKVVLDANIHLLGLLTMANDVLSSKGVRSFFQSVWKSLKERFTTTKKALIKSVDDAAAVFDLLAAQSQEEEHKVQVTEREAQGYERARAESARAAQSSHFRHVEEEAHLQAQERIQAQTFRAREREARIEALDERKQRERHKIMKWFNRCDTVMAYQNALAKHADNPTSCTWIFDSPEYRQWQDEEDPSHALWLHSGPGTGKTVLTGQIIQMLQENNYKEGSTVLYFLLNGVNASKDDPLAILRTLLCQLLEDLPDLPEWITTSYNDSYRRGMDAAQFLNSILLQDMLIKTLQLFGRVHIVIDGIDELADREYLLRLLESLGRRCVNQAINILVVSRRESDIRKALKSFISLAVRPSDTKADIDRYITKSIEAKLEVTEDQKQLALRTLTQKARGMFIWVRLVIDMLRDAATTDEFEQILTTVPQDLHEIYCVVIERIHQKVAKGPDSRMKRAHAIFKWLALAFRPLQISEIQEALALEESQGPRLNKEKSWQENMSAFRPSEQSVIEICGTLVDESDGSICLMHHTIREFLLSSSGARSANVQKYIVYSNSGNASMAESCLSYLFHVETQVHCFLAAGMDKINNKRTEAQREIRVNLPLYDYACRQWPFHFGRCTVEVNGPVLKAFARFQFCTSWYQGWSLFHPFGRVPHSRLFKRLKKHGRLVHEWLNLLDNMLGPFASSNSVSLDEIDENTRNAVQLLAERCDDALTCDPYVLKSVDLESAATRGHYDVIRWLLKKRTVSYMEVRVALIAASSMSHEETIWVLCDYLINSDMNPSALERARFDGDSQLVDILERHLEEVQAKIEQFLKSGSGPRILTLIPDSDGSEEDLPSLPYWESFPGGGARDFGYAYSRGFDSRARGIGSSNGNIDRCTNTEHWHYGVHFDANERHKDRELSRLVKHRNDRDDGHGFSPNTQRDRLSFSSSGRRDSVPGAQYRSFLQSHPRLQELEQDDLSTQSYIPPADTDHDSECNVEHRSPNDMHHPASYPVRKVAIPASSPNTTSTRPPGPIVREVRTRTVTYRPKSRLYTSHTDAETHGGTDGSIPLRPAIQVRHPIGERDPSAQTERRVPEHSPASRGQQEAVHRPAIVQDVCTCSACRSLGANSNAEPAGKEPEQREPLNERRSRIPRPRRKKR